MQRGRLMILLGGVFTLLGLFAMPMKRANPRQNLVDNPFGWGLFGFGLASLVAGASANARGQQQETVQGVDSDPDSMERIEVKKGVMQRLEH